MRLPLMIPAVAAAAVPFATVQAAPTPRGQTIAVACSGAVATLGRKTARENDLKFGQDPKACFGRMQIYDGPNRQFVVVAPTKACPGGKAIDVYDRSRAGPWYSFFEKPVCGSKLSIGPKNQWGDWMLTIDGKRSHSRGAYYVPAN